MKLSKIGLLFSVALVGCAVNNRTPAPVVDKNVTDARKASAKKAPPEKDWRPRVYTVQKGDTLYSIALNHGLDYREIAELNSLADPNLILIGQQLRLFNEQETNVAGMPDKMATKPTVDAKDANKPETKPIETAKVETIPLPPAKKTGDATSIDAKPNPLIKDHPKLLKLPYNDENVAKVTGKQPVVEIKEEKKEDKKEDKKTDEDKASSELDWLAPTTGKVIAGFSEANNNKGVDIAGKLGQPVLASAAGKVVYSGSGLRGYGKLIIIKHNNVYLTAYAHNDQVLVKEGQSVTRGQKIAEMGNSDAEQVKLHFEVRRLGKPVDPAKYIQL